MGVLVYEPKSKGLDVDLDRDRLSSLRSPNVRGVALRALDTKELINKDDSLRIQGTYSEAYQGEVA